MHKHVRELAKKVKPIGWTTDGSVDGNGHVVFVHETGPIYSVPSTPSEYRSLKNCLSDLERIAGRRTARVNRRRSHKSPQTSGFSIAVAHDEQAARQRIRRQLAAKRRELDEVLEAQRRALATGNQVYLRRLTNDQHILLVQIDDLKDRFYAYSA